MEKIVTTLRAGMEYRRKGISVIPLLPGGKKPAIAWLEFQKRIASEEEIIEWFSAGNKNIGLVTGEISNLTVVDCDTEQAVYRMTEELADGPEVPIQFTPRGGRHFFFQYTKEFSNKRMSDGIDIRTEGGCVCAFPSTIGERGWNWGRSRSILKVSTPVMAERIKVFLRALPGRGSAHDGTNGERRGPDTSTMFQGGQLDEDLFTVSNSLVKGGMPAEQVKKVLEVIAEYGNKNRDGRPPFTPADVTAKVQSAIQRAERKDINLSKEIRDWVSVAPGSFEIKDIERALHLSDMNDYKTVWTIVNTMVKEEIIEKVGTRRGSYRMKQTEFEVMDFEAAEERIVNLKWPLGIESMYRCYPGSISVLAGAMGSGKTTFCLNFCLNNLKEHKITYLSSELGTAELRDRISLFGYPRDVWKDVSFKKVNSNFEDAVDPDSINIIDYLEEYDEIWKIALHMKDINNRLKSGTALIAMQRPYNREVAKGGEGTLEKPRLYLTMDHPYGEDHRIKIIKAHNWVDPLDNPNHKAKRFKIIRGSRIEPTSGWAREAPAQVDWAVNRRGK